MNMKTLWIIIGIIVVIGLGWWFLGQTPAAAPTQETGQVQGASDETQPGDNSKDGAADTSASAGVSAGVTVGTIPAAVTVTYSNAGFSPSTITVKKGQSVTFVNKSTNEMWVASNPHPTHEGYSGTTKDQHCPDTAGTALDECSFGSSYTFVFGKVGTWGYHNHAVHSDTGTVIVTN